MKYWSLISLLFIFNLVAWFQIWQIDQTKNHAAIYFLNVGQGDSELIEKDGVQILVDGGPDASVLKNLEKIMLPADRYIDLVILTHPHLDHFGGLIDVFKNYQVGTFIDNGLTRDIPEYQEFVKTLTQNGARRLILAENDNIKYEDLEIKLIWPPPNSPTPQKDIHDKTIVFLLLEKNLRALFTGDINFKVEDNLLKHHRAQLKAGVLKVSHHGSKNSTSEKFLKAVRPKISIIEVGKNSYGHPNPTLINRIKQSNSLIYTTLEHGLIKLIPTSDQLRVLTEK